MKDKNLKIVGSIIILLLLYKKFISNNKKDSITPDNLTTTSTNTNIDNGEKIIIKKQTINNKEIDSYVIIKKFSQKINNTLYQGATIYFYNFIGYWLIGGNVPEYDGFATPRGWVNFEITDKTIDQIQASDYIKLPFIVPYFPDDKYTIVHEKDKGHNENYNLDITIDKPTILTYDVYTITG
jgi:hypothetical protein